MPFPALSQRSLGASSLGNYERLKEPCLFAKLSKRPAYRASNPTQSAIPSPSRASARAVRRKTARPGPRTLGHDEVRTTFSRYGSVAPHRQADLIRGATRGGGGSGRSERPAGPPLVEDGRHSVSFRVETGLFSARNACDSRLLNLNCPGVAALPAGPDIAGPSLSRNWGH